MKSRFLLGVFSLSAILITLQILQSRIFSVTTWYHLSFLVISVAMFGLTLGALKVYRGNEGYQRRHCPELMAAATRRFGLSIMVALLGQMFIPLLTGDPREFSVTLTVLCALTVMPYYQVGVALSLAITRSPYPVSQVYGVDLLGAAAGCLIVLGLMCLIPTPSAVMLLSLLCLACAACFAGQEHALPETRRTLQMSRIAAIPVAALLIINFFTPLISPLWVKEQLMASNSFTYDKWNAISRVTVSPKTDGEDIFLWGPSPIFPEAAYNVPNYMLKMDGDAGTPITEFKYGETDLSYLDYDVTTIAYAIPGIQSAAIIGVGGGRDVLSAHRAGIDRIVALDVNNVQISLLNEIEPYRSEAGLTDIPGLSLVHSEARSWFAREDEKFDLIQMSLIDTWAATGAGAFTLTENGLYTVEAWRIFLDRLTPQGVLTVSRWYSTDARSETERVMSLALAALFELGVQKPVDHIYMASSGHISTFVVSREPLSDAYLDALDKRARTMDFTTHLSPRMKIEDENWKRLGEISNRAELEEYGRVSKFDISPATDHRPFFFNQVRINDPWAVFELLSKDNTGARIGNARAIINLYLILMIAAGMVIAVILYPARDALYADRPRIIAGGTLWFLMIGLGFMFVEIALIQRMGVYLGHPNYGLGVILFSLILSTGIGSIVSGYIPLNSTGRRVIWVAFVSAAIFLSIGFIDKMVITFASVELWLRAFLSVMVILPVGFLMGFGFPTGMLLVGEESRATPWFWGINGAAGVLGGVLAMFINLPYGLNMTLTMGGLCYFFLIIPALLLSSATKLKGPELAKY